MPTKKPMKQTKSASVIASLNRSEGATLDEICNASQWKMHSVRAFLTGLRKKGFILSHQQRGDGGTASRIAQTSDQYADPGVL